MKYTRYNYKPPKKRNNFIIIITLTLIAAIALGTIFSKLLPNNSVTNAENKTTKVTLDKDSTANAQSVDVSNVISQTNIKDYVAIQCGVFSTMERALIVKNSLATFGAPFIIVEGKLNKVFLGVYPKDGIDTIIKQLQTAKTTYVKINLQLNGKDSTSAQVNEIISADVKILNKLSEKDVKAYTTVAVKKWMGSLEGADVKSTSYSNLTQIKAYLTALPAEIKKEKTEEGYIYIYNFINKLSKTQL
ncbi:MAG TPA: hypothetical protein VIM70_22645 [Clostridium sp.]|uniref:hypothetical protein n=1 Tax=Clostridium sp. TaxID=1506 RepID=UPI002F94E833